MPKHPLIFTLCCLFLSAGLLAQNAEISESDAVALGRKLEMEVNSGNAAALFIAIDSAAFYGKIQAGSPVAQNPAFMKGFQESFSLLKFAGPVQEVVNKGSFHFLRSYEKDGNQHLLFRLLPGKGMNYYDFTLMKTRGIIKASDVLLYINGENLSVTMIDLIETMANSVTNPQELSSLRSSMNKLTALKSKGDWVGVKAEYDQLDEHLRQDKALELVNIIACQHIDNLAYKKALEEYAHDFPGATNAYLMMIDMYSLNGEYERAIDVINKIDSITGGDPALDYFRGNQYTNMKRSDSALQCYTRVFAYDPSLSNNVKKLVAYYINSGEKEKARHVLAQYEKTAGAKTAFIDSLYAELPGLK